MKIGYKDQKLTAVIAFTKETVKNKNGEFTSESNCVSENSFRTGKAQTTNLINAAKSGRYKELTVREAWLNTLVAIEVYCWFYIGECIGKRHIVGYKVNI
ncbi:hypothetical protein HZH66_010876 [Vespula vulgaris]|uniref:Uncharacterized protein n=1 Tax=Vespula vulgaris TaxID=7454 RepID=A0A834JJC1_VESVU|nr:hypothetical protein HZH66_010876 [Vespula vulgaris]